MIRKSCQNCKCHNKEKISCNHRYWNLCIIRDDGGYVIDYLYHQFAIIEKMTIEQVLGYKGKNLNIQYVIRCLPLEELERVKNWNGVKYITFEDWFYANCV